MIASALSFFLKIHFEWVILFQIMVLILKNFFLKFRSIPLENLVAIVKRNFTLGVLIEEWVGPDDRNSLGHIIQVR